MQAKNCNPLCGMHECLIGCNFLFIFLPLYPNKNKLAAIPASLCAILRRYRNLYLTIRINRNKTRTMKNLWIIALIFLPVRKSFSQNLSDSISNKKFYIDLFGNYGLLPAGEHAIATKSFPSGTENVYGTYGQGISYGVNIGCMFNKHISGELGFSMLSGNDVKTTQDLQYNSSVRTLNGKMSRLELAAKISTGKKFKPFLKFGIIYGIKTEINSDYVSKGTGTFTEEAKYSGGSCFGYKGSFGSDYNISKSLSVYLEFQMINITWAPEKGEWSSTYDDGNNITNHSGSRTYVDKVTANMLNSELKYFYPFGSLGITAGIKFMFGKTRK